MKRIVKNIIVILLVFLAIACRNPAPNCNQFCSFRTNIKNAANLNNEGGFGKFNEKGSPRVCGPYGTEWPSFDVWANVETSNPVQQFHICTNNASPLNPSGESQWINGNCITLNQAKQYQNTKISFELKNLQNQFFLVKGQPGICQGQCVLYYIKGLKGLLGGDYRYTIDKKKCGINIDIKAYPYKYGNNFICKPCNC